MLRSRLFHAIILGGASLASSMLACTEESTAPTGATTSSPHEPPTATPEAADAADVVDGDAASSERDAAEAELDASSDAADERDASGDAEDASDDAGGRDGGWHPTK